MKMENNYEVEYYFTKKSEKLGTYDQYDVIDKRKISLQSSNNNIGEGVDLFILKKNFTDMKPSPHDLILFENSFFQSKKVEESGEFYIIDIVRYL